MGERGGEIDWKLLQFMYLTVSAEVIGLRLFIVIIMFPVTGNKPSQVQGQSGEHVRLNPNRVEHELRRTFT